tara:strand:+ start:628 stop:1038 length:411 start_codon:yes stop_codon:yes gene_type:complete
MKLVKFLMITVMVLSLTSCGYYRDYSREQKFKDAENNGKSELIEAEHSKRALIETAKAENEANEMIASSRIKLAKADAQAEIERAIGVAKANEIIGESLKNGDQYLKYLQIEAIKQAKGTVYIATEAGLPILEARK